MLQAGDKYIHFTKYGGVNFGVVKEIWNVYVLSTDKGCMYLKPQLRNEKGVNYDVNEDGKFFKIEKEYTPEEIEAIRENMKRLAGMKKHDRSVEVLKDVKKLPHEKADL
jgi:hypothetical protein